MKYNLIVYESKSWILKKFSNEIGIILEAKGYTVTQTTELLDSNSDIYVHFWHSMVDIAQITKITKSRHIIFVTHFSNPKQINKLVYLSRHCKNVGFIFMSNYTQKIVSKILLNAQTHAVNIIPPFNQLNYSYENLNNSDLTIGIFSNYYNDGRKNEDFIIDNLTKIKQTLINNNINLIIRIYGQFWRESPLFKVLQVEGNKEIQIDLIETEIFQHKKYIEILKSVDYYVYLGFDEGSMSFLDALYFNTKTIVADQGFHHDLSELVDYNFRSKDEFLDIMLNIISKRNTHKKLITTMNWNYYVDQIFILEKNLNNDIKISSLERFYVKLNYILYRNSILRSLHLKK